MLAGLRAPLSSLRLSRSACCKQVEPGGTRQAYARHSSYWFDNAHPLNLISLFKMATYKLCLVKFLLALLVYKYKRAYRRSDQN